MYNVRLGGQSGPESRFVDAISRIAKKYKNTVFLGGDDICECESFFKFFDDRCFNFGDMGGNVVLSAVGFSVRGKLPVILGSSEMAASACEVIRNGICLPNLNVKIVGVGGDCLDDVEMMKMLPNMEVFDDFPKMVEEYGPGYLRLTR